MQTWTAILESTQQETPIDRTLVLLVGLVFAMVFCVQAMFLERLAEARGFRDVKLFYLIYSPTAITLRVIFRRLPQRIGRTRTMLMGLLLMAVGLCCLIGVESQWRLILPGILMGAGHCFIFPSMVDLAAAHFPPQHRGAGTSLLRTRSLRSTRSTVSRPYRGPTLPPSRLSEFSAPVSPVVST